MDQRKARRGRMYWLGDRPYISVTNILKIIDKPALVHWFGREVYYAMVKDPTLTEKDALASPYSTSGVARNRGTTVHSFVEAHRQGAPLEEVLAGMPPNLKGYAQAFYDWVTEHKVHFLEHERTVLSSKYGFGGTADIRCTMNDQPDIWLIDAKTGKAIYPEVELQLSAYKQGYLEMNERVDKIGVCLLETGQDDKPTGHYVFSERTDNLEVFLAAKRVWEWANQGMLKKIKYYEYATK